MDKTLPSVIIVSGAQGSGKTTLCERIAKAAVASGRSAGGITCPGIFSDGEKTGCMIHDLAEGTEIEFGSCVRKIGETSWKRWSFSSAGIESGNDAVSRALERGCDIVILDEAGPLELVDGKGFWPSIDRLALERLAVEKHARCKTENPGGGKTFIITARPSLLEALGFLFPGAALIPLAGGSESMELAYDAIAAALFSLPTP